MLVGGRRVPVVGRVCMDLTMLDVGAVSGVQIEDEVVIFGKQGNESISADDLARALGTITTNRLRSHGAGAASLSKQPIIMNRHLLF